MAMESRVHSDFLCNGFFSEKKRFTESSCFVNSEEGNFHMEQIDEGLKDSLIIITRLKSGEFCIENFVERGNA